MIYNVNKQIAFDKEFTMVDPNTFLTTLYVMADDFCKVKLGAERHRQGRRSSLCRSEVVTLAIFGQWWRFRSERDFYRYADKVLRGAFPRLPDRSQFNRLQREHVHAVIAFGHHIATEMEARNAVFEVLDGMGVRTRNTKRRGRGWLAGYANIGWCNRLGWYAGFHVMTAVTPIGVITGYGFAPASTKEQPYTDTFLAARTCAHPHLPEVGLPAQGYYIADNGFHGAPNQRRWAQAYHADVISPPQNSHPSAWPKPFRRWFDGHRQIVETVHEKLLSFFRLDLDRAHDLAGFRMRLAAKAALHNFCIWLNRQLGRDNLAFADLVDWP